MKIITIAENEDSVPADVLVKATRRAAVMCILYNYVRINWHNWVFQILMKGSDEYSTPQEGEGELMVMDFFFFQEKLRHLGSDECSTPSPITVTAWSTCDSCGESDEDSAPSAVFNPPDRDFRQVNMYRGY